MAPGGWWSRIQELQRAPPPAVDLDLEHVLGDMPRKTYTFDRCAARSFSGPDWAWAEHVRARHLSMGLGPAVLHLVGILGVLNVKLQALQHVPGDMPRKTYTFDRCAARCFQALPA